MGAEQLNVVVDTGPLIHLAEIDCLSLFSVFTELHIPDAVWHEARSPSSIREQLSGAHRWTLESRDIEEFVAAHRLRHLQMGELECLFLSRRERIPTLLTDDLAVRDAARALGITPVGSLGIILKSYKLGRLSFEEADHRLQELDRTSSLYVTRAIIELARERLDAMRTRRA